MTGQEYHRFVQLVKRLRKAGMMAWNEADEAEKKAKAAKELTEKMAPSMEFARKAGVREAYRDSADAIENLLAELNS
jgi:hypothetical protein